MFSDGKGGEQMLVAVSTHPKKTGRFYFEIDEGDITLYEKCAVELEKRRTAFRSKYGVDPVPADAIPTPDGKEYRDGGTHWHTVSVVTHGYTRWEHLFNTRQLLGLASILDILRQTETRLITEYGQEYGIVLMAYLSLVLNKTVEKYSRLSPWHRDEMVVSCFAQQAIRNALGLYRNRTIKYLAWQCKISIRGVGTVSLSSKQKQVSCPDGFSNEYTI